MEGSSISEAGRTRLSSQERARFESYMAEIFSRLGMDLDSEPCKRTPHRWLQALVDMTEGYNGDPTIEVVFKRECVNCAQDIPTVQIVEGLSISLLCASTMFCRLSARPISGACVMRRSLDSRNSRALCANMRAGLQYKSA